MILSVNQELNEYKLVCQPEHVSKVWKVVEAAIPKYWELFVKAEREKTPAAKLAARFGGDVSAKEAAVIANDGALSPGKMVIVSGTYQVHLSMKNKAGGGPDPHAGHNH